MREGTLNPHALGSLLGLDGPVDGVVRDLAAHAQRVGLRLLKVREDEHVAVATRPRPAVVAARALEREPHLHAQRRPAVAAVHVLRAAVREAAQDLEQRRQGGQRRTASDRWTSRAARALVRLVRFVLQSRRGVERQCPWSGKSKSAARTACTRRRRSGRARSWRGRSRTRRRPWPFRRGPASLGLRRSRPSPWREPRCQRRLQWRKRRRSRRGWLLGRSDCSHSADFHHTPSMLSHSPTHPRSARDAKGTSVRPSVLVYASPRLGLGSSVRPSVCLPVCLGRASRSSHRRRVAVGAEPPPHGRPNRRGRVRALDSHASPSRERERLQIAGGIRGLLRCSYGELYGGEHRRRRAERRLRRTECLREAAWIVHFPPVGRTSAKSSSSAAEAAGGGTQPRLTHRMT